MKKVWICLGLVLVLLAIGLISVSATTGDEIWETYDVSLNGGYDDPASVSVDVSVPIFWVTFVVLGYLVPIAPLVLGLVFALGKKRSHPTRWFWVVGLAGAWMMISLMITILLLI